jgi:hypothetical protein
LQQVNTARAAKDMALTDHLLSAKALRVECVDAAQGKPRGAQELLDLGAEGVAEVQVLVASV